MESAILTRAVVLRIEKLGISLRFGLSEFLGYGVRMSVFAGF